MPLPQVTVQNLVVTDFQGLNIERNVLVRPENSWQALVNFDLVKPGVIRKIKGNKRLTINPVSPLVAFRDYQKAQGGPEFLVAVSATGRVYISGVQDDPITLIEVGQLLDPLQHFDETPYIVSVPFMENGDQVQYIIITCGDTRQPVKFNGLPLDGITVLGIQNPGDTWTVEGQHAVVAPQLIYNEPTLGDIYLYTSPNPAQGVGINAGRQYRAAWYNSVTGHRSSLFPLSNLTLATQATLGSTDVKSANKPLGILQTTTPAPFVMAVPLFLDNAPDHLPIELIPAPQQDYNQIQIFATRDGDGTFYLVPTLYDRDGAVLTDENSAISLSDLRYGFGLLTSSANERPFYDGFIPLLDNGPTGEGLWHSPVKYNDTIEYTVNGGSQSGNTLNVTREVGSVSIGRGYFALPDDVTQYRIVSSTGGANATWTIEPALNSSPIDNAPIQFIFVKPVLDIQLFTPFNDSTETPFDRVNDPPPRASWGCVYQNRLFLLNANDKTELAYSRIGDYESFPPDNRFRFTQSDFDPITAILAGRQVGLVSEGADQRMIVGKVQSTYQVTGTSILDFALTGLFPETGIVHKRAAIVVGGFTCILSRQGIEVIQGQMPYYIGSKIKDLTDNIRLEEYGPCFAIDRRDSQLLLGFDFFENLPHPPAPQINGIIVMREPRTGGEGFLSPFSTVNAFPDQLSILQESGFGDNIRMLMAPADGHIYQLYTGGTVTDVDGNITPLVSEAISQELPQQDREYRKIFRRIRFDGNEVNDDDGWRIAFMVDDGPYTDDIQMYDENLIGLAGKVLTFRIRHVRAIDEFEDPPQLSNFTLEYSVIGDSR